MQDHGANSKDWDKMASSGCWSRQGIRFKGVGWVPRALEGGKERLCSEQEIYDTS